MAMVVFLSVTMFYLGHNNIPEGRVLRFSILFELLIVSASFFFFVIPNVWYANCLSLLNMMCGLLGILLLLTFKDKPMLYLKEAVFMLVFLGQFFDMFDGRAAEVWGSTPRGEMFDDVADGTSFGFTVGLLITFAANNKYVGMGVGFLHAVTTFYRLVRFIVEKHKAGVTGGVVTFSGMPSPAAALIMGTLSIILGRFGSVGDVLLVIVGLVSAGVSISRIPYPHMSRAFLAWIPRRMLLLWFVVGSCATVTCVAYHEVWLPILSINVCSVFYMISPFIIKLGLFQRPVFVRLAEMLYLRSRNGSRYINSMAKEAKE